MGEPAHAFAPLDAGCESLIAWWAASTALWQIELGTPTPEAIVWQPFNRSHSIGGILLHLADVEGRWIEECLNGTARSADERELLRSDENMPHDGRWCDPPAWAYSEYLDILAWVRRRSVATLQKFEPEHAFIGPKGMTTVEAAVRFLCFHEAYHIGQAVLHNEHFAWGGIEPQ